MVLINYTEDRPNVRSSLPSQHFNNEVYMTDAISSRLSTFQKSVKQKNAIPRHVGGIWDSYDSNNSTEDSIIPQANLRNETDVLSSYKIPAQYSKQAAIEPAIPLLPSNKPKELKENISKDTRCEKYSSTEFNDGNFENDFMDTSENYFNGAAVPVSSSCLKNTKFEESIVSKDVGLMKKEQFAFSSVEKLKKKNSEEEISADRSKRHKTGSSMDTEAALQEGKELIKRLKKNALSIGNIVTNSRDILFDTSKGSKFYSRMPFAADGAEAIEKPKRNKSVADESKAKDKSLQQIPVVDEAQVNDITKQSEQKSKKVTVADSYPCQADSTCKYDTTNQPEIILTNDKMTPVNVTRSYCEEIEVLERVCSIFKEMPPDRLGSKVSLLEEVGHLKRICGILKELESCVSENENRESLKVVEGAEQLKFCDGLKAGEAVSFLGESEVYTTKSCLDLNLFADTSVCDSEQIGAASATLTVQTMLLSTPIPAPIPLESNLHLMCPTLEVDNLPNEKSLSNAKDTKYVNELETFNAIELLSASSPMETSEHADQMPVSERLPKYRRGMDIPPRFLKAYQNRIQNKDVEAPLKDAQHSSNVEFLPTVPTQPDLQFSQCMALDSNPQKTLNNAQYSHHESTTSGKQMLPILDINAVPFSPISPMQPLKEVQTGNLVHVHKNTQNVNNLLASERSTNNNFNRRTSQEGPIYTWREQQRNDCQIAKTNANISQKPEQILSWRNRDGKAGDTIFRSNRSPPNTGIASKKPYNARKWNGNWRDRPPKTLNDRYPEKSNLNLEPEKKVLPANNVQKSNNLNLPHEKVVPQRSQNHSQKSNNLNLEPEKKILNGRTRRNSGFARTSNIVEEMITLKVFAETHNLVGELMVPDNELACAKRQYPNLSNIVPVVNVQNFKLNFSGEAIKIFLWGIFSRSFTLPNWETALEVFALAKKCHVPHLQDNCKTYFDIKPISPREVQEIVNQAKTFQITEVLQTSKMFAEVRQSVPITSDSAIPPPCKTQHCFVSCTIFVEPKEFNIPLYYMKDRGLGSTIQSDIQNDIKFLAKSGTFCITGFQIKLEAENSDLEKELNILYDVYRGGDRVFGDDRERVLRSMIIINFKQKLLVKPKEDVRISVLIEDLSLRLCHCYKQDEVREVCGEGSFEVSLKSAKKSLFFIEKLFYTFEE